MGSDQTFCFEQQSLRAHKQHMEVRTFLCFLSCRAIVRHWFSQQGVFG